MKKCILVLYLVFIPVAGYSEIYKCTKPDGTIEFSQRQCESGKQDIVDIKVKKADPAAKENEKTKVSFSIPVYPGAILKNKDDSYEGKAIFYEYKANSSFESVKAYYLKDAGEKNCSSAGKGHLNCHYRKLLGAYNSGQVAVIKHTDWVEVTIFKYK